VFPEFGWGKLRGEKSLGLNPFGGRWTRGVSAGFWQSGHKTGIFFTGNQRVHFPGFSGRDLETKKANEARKGLI
jgi:hypothetical protein